jgi:hypothetical protein
MHPVDSLLFEAGLLGRSIWCREEQRQCQHPHRCHWWPCQWQRRQQHQRQRRQWCRQWCQNDDATDNDTKDANNANDNANTDENNADNNAINDTVKDSEDDANDANDNAADDDAKDANEASDDINADDDVADDDIADDDVDDNTDNNHTADKNVEGKIYNELADNDADNNNTVNYNADDNNNADKDADDNTYNKVNNDAASLVAAVSLPIGIVVNMASIINPYIFRVVCQDIPFAILCCAMMLNSHQFWPSDLQWLTTVKTIAMLMALIATLMVMGISNPPPATLAQPPKMGHPKLLFSQAHRLPPMTSSPQL